MYETDVERLEAQARRVRSIADDLLDTAETLSEDGHDTTSSGTVSDRQDDFVAEVEQLLADGSAILDHADSLDRRPEYDSDRTLFSIDVADGVATVTYNGDTERNVSDINLVTRVSGNSVGSFTGTLQPGDTAEVDVSGAAEGDLVEVVWVSTLIGEKHKLPKQSQSPVNRSNLPQSNLVEESRERSVSREL